MNNVSAEVIPEFSNIDIMFKAIIIIFILGFIVGIIYTIYQLIN